MERDMTKGSPTKLILMFSIPLLIGNIFQQFYSMVDAIIVGKFIGVNALAAVGSTGSMSFLLLGFVFGLTGGFAVITAQKFGAKDDEGLRSSVVTIIYLCVIATVLLTIIGLISAKPLLEVMNTPKDIVDQAYSYIIVIYAGIGVTFLYNMMACILRAMGDSRSPLYFLILSSVLNIILDVLFIRFLGMGVAGAAYATIISQGISGVLCVFYALKYYPVLRLNKADWKWNRYLVGKHLVLGLPMAFQFSITAIGVIVLQGALNLLGTGKIAAFTAANKVEQLVVQPGNTFGVAIANYTAQNLGAHKFDRIRFGARKAAIITILFALAAGLIVVLFGKPLILLFVKKEEVEVILAAQQYLRTIAIFFPALNLLFIYRNVLLGIGRSFMPFMAGIFELVVRTAAAFVLPTLIGFQGIALAGPLAWISAAVPLFLAYKVNIRKKVYQSTEKNEDIINE